MKKISLALFCYALLTLLLVRHESAELSQLLEEVSPVKEITLPTKEETESDVVLGLQDNKNLPSITASNWLIYDVTQQSYVVEINADEAVAPASTTKILTALTALEEYDEKEIVTLLPSSSVVGTKSLVSNTQYMTVDNVVEAMLVGSYNDFALSLALHHPNNYQGFVSAMNRELHELEIENSVTNPSGLDGEFHSLSAKDLATISIAALQQPLLKEIVKKETTNVSDAFNEYSYEVANTNKLLGVVPGLFGIKTGRTANAGECLVSYVNRDGKEIIIVVLGSFDRFGDTQQLVNWLFS